MARLKNKDCIPEIDFQRCRDRISIRLNNDGEIDLKDFNKRLIIKYAKYVKNDGKIDWQRLLTKDWQSKDADEYEDQIENSFAL